MLADHHGAIAAFIHGRIEDGEKKGRELQGETAGNPHTHGGVRRS
jgi:hypothetical protein